MRHPHIITSNAVVKTMSLCEEPQVAERPCPLSRRPRRKSSSSAGPDYVPESATCVRRRGRLIEKDGTDEMLMKGIADGDKAAMHVMYERYRTRVFRFVHRMVSNPTIVEDIVSHVFLDLWRCAGNFEQRARVSTWLFSIARFKALTVLSERVHESINQDEVLSVADAADSPEAALGHKQTNGILRACLNELSPAHREIIELFYYRDKSVVEVSRIAGIPLATVKSRMFYARKQLAQILLAAGFGASAVSERKPA
jgi:RNA polymerase sigma-70 factor, ECF subfamily